MNTASPGTAAPKTPKNIVLFIADDLSPDAGCYGNVAVKTPHLDRLAADGVLFQHAYCTTASCSPSRSVVLTGLHNHANGQYGLAHGPHKFASYPWVQSLPVMLARTGYRTARIGKYHVMPEEVYRFETNLEGNARNPVEMAQRCEAFVRGMPAQRDQPFFLYFATSDAHRGGGHANELPYGPDRFGNRPDRGEYAHVREVFYDPGHVIVPPFLPDTPTCRAEIAQYYQSISRIDQGLGALIEVLKQAGKWDDTLLLFTSDHGMPFPGAKTTVYDPGLRVPLVVRSPRQSRRGIVHRAMVSLVDITPTLLDWAGALDATTGHARRDLVAPSAGEGLPAPARWGGAFHGRSFLSILEAPDPPGWDEIYAAHTFHEVTMYFPMRCVRGRRWKLIWNVAHPLPFPFASDLWGAPTWQAQLAQGIDAPYGKSTVGQVMERDEFELYDLQQDPHETSNLADDPEFRQVLDDLKARIQRFQDETQDPWRLKWNRE